MVSGMKRGVKRGHTATPFFVIALEERVLKLSPLPVVSNDTLLIARDPSIPLNAIPSSILAINSLYTVANVRIEIRNRHSHRAIRIRVHTRTRSHICEICRATGFGSRRPLYIASRRCTLDTESRCNSCMSVDLRPEEDNSRHRDDREPAECLVEHCE